MTPTSTEAGGGVLSVRTRAVSRLGGVSLGMWLRLPLDANEYELQLQLPQVRVVLLFCCSPPALLLALEGLCRRPRHV